MLKEIKKVEKNIKKGIKNVTDSIHDAKIEKEADLVYTKYNYKTDVYFWELEIIVAGGPNHDSKEERIHWLSTYLKQTEKCYITLYRLNKRCSKPNKNIETWLKNISETAETIKKELKKAKMM